MNFDDELHAGAFTGTGIPFTITADFLQAFAHVRQAVSGTEPATLGIFWHRGLQNKTMPIVCHHKHETVRTQLERQADFRGAGVLDHIVQCLFEGKKYIMADFRSKSPSRKIHRHIQTETDVRATEEMLGETAQISHQAVESIVTAAEQIDFNKIGAACQVFTALGQIGVPIVPGILLLGLSTSITVMTRRPGASRIFK